MQIDRIKYTMKHRKAFRAVEKQLLGHNTIRGYLHDLTPHFESKDTCGLCTNGYRLGMCQTYKAGQADECQRNTG